MECTNGAPRILWWRGRRILIRHTVGPERLAGDWWKDTYARDYWRCEEDAESGGSTATFMIYRDLGPVPAETRWFMHGWWD